MSTVAVADIAIVESVSTLLESAENSKRKLRRQGCHINSQAVDEIESLIELGAWLGLESDIFVAEDQASVAFYKAQRTLEVVITNDGERDLFYEEGRGPQLQLQHVVERASGAVIRRELRSLSGRWYSSESSNEAYSIRGERGSQTPLSNVVLEQIRPAQTGTTGFRLYPLTARAQGMDPVIVPANTSVSIIASRSEEISYSGNLMIQSS